MFRWISLSFYNKSSSATTDKEKHEEIHCKKSECCMEMSSGAFPLEWSDSDTDGGISLQLSFSGDITSTGTSKTDKGKLKEIHCKKSEGTTMSCMEMISIGAFSSEWSDSSTDGGISLQLSLSGDITSTETSKTDKGKQVIVYKESVPNMMCMEKNSDALSQEPADKLLELSLAVNRNWRFEVGECSYRRNLNKSCSIKKDFERGLTLALSPGFASHNKRKARENPKHCVTVYKRKRVELETEAVPRRVPDQLRNGNGPGAGHDPWCIRKRLTKSDLSDMSRLLLAWELVESHILPHWDEDRKAQIRKGLQVRVHDCDTNSEHAMVFKRWDNGAHVLINKWIPQFVKRRNLKLNDEIGLHWDIQNSRFNFCVLNRA
ncbi:hypothetical protein V6N13_027877 [Hibiscus sabdariffa]|uniref:B3 domain-containing protein n=1 Tax=Hibiscus sabdariffa TaxID=183260 RepID=A0ABR2CG51_9ROSI